MLSRLPTTIFRSRRRSGARVSQPTLYDVGFLKTFETNRSAVPVDSKPTTPVVLVTGGTGFIGSHLVDHLVKDGVCVRVLARRETPILAAHRGHVEVLLGDIRDREVVDSAMQGVDTVYHLAAFTKPWARDEREFAATNAGGTLNVCEAARRCGTRKVVHVSTALLAPPSEPELPVTYERTAYQRSKLEAEKRVEGYVHAGGSAVIVRPSRTYGPGPLNQSNSVTKLIDLYSRGRFRFRIDDASARANYVHVEDVVDGLIRAARYGSDGVAYVLGGANRTLEEFLTTIAEVSGRRFSVFSIAPPIAKLFGLGSEIVARFGMDPIITRDWVDLLSIDWPVSSGPAEVALGYEPMSIEVGLAQTLGWLKGGRALPFAAA